MRPLLAVLVALVGSLILLVSVGAMADISDPGAPRYANQVLIDFVAPTVHPGQTAVFSVKVNNTYSNGTHSETMTNITLGIGIYMYATEEVAREVNSSFQNPPLINGESTELVVNIPSLEYGSSQLVTFDIDTSKKTPHGTYYSQSTYFLRFSLEFNLGNTSKVVLKSKGCFTQDEWSKIVPVVNGTTRLNMSYLNSLGVLGLIPDSSFGLKEPIPMWPLYGLIAACVAVVFSIVYYFVLDNPGKFPRLEKRFYYLRGKLSESRRKLQNRSRK